MHLEHLPPTPEPALRALARRAGQMQAAELPATTLLVDDSGGYRDFSAFVALAEAAEGLLESHFGEVLTLAYFHPDFAFAGLPPTAPAHLIHRAPFPILQLLRRADTAFAKTRVDVDALLERNAAHAATLGPEFFAQYL